jgi:hypothetical protein
MPLKLKKSQASPESSSAKDDLSGPWGRINPEPQAAIALRLCKKTSPSSEETYSYPYRVLSSWHWRGGIAEEELEIEAGSDLVTVTGRGLERLVEALDRSALEILNETPESKSGMADDPIQISSINISYPRDASR